MTRFFSNDDRFGFKNIAAIEECRVFYAKFAIIS